MSDIALPVPEPTSEAEYIASLQYMMAEMHQLNERIEQEQNRIIRLKIETDALRGETQRLKAETRATLARMGELV